MKRKSNILKYALSLITDQFLAVLASVILMIITNFFFPNRFLFLEYLISVLIFTALIYVDSWGRGSSDKSNSKIGIATHSRIKGFIFGLCATIPSVLIALLAFLTETGFLSSYKVLNVDVFVLINRFWQMPLRIFYGAVNKAPVLNLLLPLFVPLISGFGYILGSEDITLKNIILYEKRAK